MRREEAGNSHILLAALLEPVHLPVANVIVLIRQCQLPTPHLSPPALRSLALLRRDGAVEVQRASYAELHGIVHRDRVDLAVDIEGEGEVVVDTVDARNAIILFLVNRGDMEGRVEEECVGAAKLRVRGWGGTEERKGLHTTWRGVGSTEGCMDVGRSVGS
jgi:hypothetical protein